MMGKWQSYKVIQLQKAGKLLVEDGNHGEYRPRRHEFVETGTAFIRAGDLSNDGRILFESAQRINSTALARIRKGIGQPCDVILSHKGTVGRVAFAPVGCEPFVCSPQTTFWRSLDPSYIEPRYLFYFLRSDHFRKQLYATKSGTDMADYVSLTDQRNLEVLLPPLPEQRRIAQILGRLDDKIEVNRRINRTLEAMAQALYKHWFVDFGPFQDGEFVESELGLVPKGWEVSTIGAECQVVSGGTPSTKIAEYWGDGTIYWATPTDMTALNSPVIFNTKRRITQLGLENSSAKLLPPGSVLMTSRATLGFVAINYVPMSTNQGFKSMIPGERVTAVYLLLYVKHNQDEILNRASGTTFMEINSRNFKALKILVPPIEVMRKFDKIVRKYFAQVYALEQETVHLAATRDYLLPRLLSGEVEVI